MYPSPKLTFICVTILFLTAFSGCTYQQSVVDRIISVYLGSSFQLEINQTAFVEEESIKIKFLKVSEDSRCPLDVVCFWEGQATILLAVLKSDGVLAQFNVTKRAGHEELAVKNLDGYTVRLLNVEPYPTTNQWVENVTYTVTLVVSSLE